MTYLGVMSSDLFVTYQCDLESSVWLELHTWDLYWLQFNRWRCIGYMYLCLINQSSSMNTLEKINFNSWLNLEINKSKQLEIMPKNLYRVLLYFIILVLLIGTIVNILHRKCLRRWFKQLLYLHVELKESLKCI